MKTITENKIFEKAFREMEIFENPILNDDIHVTFFITSTLNEITVYPCNLIGSQQCDLLLNRTIFCSRSHLFQIASFMF